jgi:xanthine dehydrogenase accessory factor
MQQFFVKMTALTAQEESFVLATIITRNGSAPRSTGARMLILADGTTIGTVGGGILEARVEQRAREVLKTGATVVENFQFSGKDAATMDAICGGQVDVLMEWVNAADPDWKAVLEGIRSIAARHKKAWLLTAIPEGIYAGKTTSSHTALSHTIIELDGTILGSLPSGLTLEKVLNTFEPELISIADQRWMVEPLETGGTVFIFGAGHVGRCLASFTRAVGFWTVVLDDRPEYANPQNIPSADVVILLNSFEDAIKNLQIGPDSFIVIVTRGHLNDRIVLTQALRTPAGYIGMIGSRRKCALIYGEIRKEGFKDADIQRVHAPIGLPIRAETPEEIGISITAEMIQVRAELPG